MNCTSHLEIAQSNVNSYTRCTMYTSWHERRASRDMVEVSAWLNEGGDVPNTVRMAHLQAERLLLVRRRHGAVYKAINALLRKNGAIDFAPGEALAEITRDPSINLVWAKVIDVYEFLLCPNFQARLAYSP